MDTSGLWAEGDRRGRVVEKYFETDLKIVGFGIFMGLVDFKKNIEEQLYPLFVCSK